jgi:hypothetical protein
MRKTRRKDLIMDKGIRPAARNKFVELNELRRRGEAPYVGPKANTIFRKNVMCFLMDEFGITLASAATHYNEAFKLVKEATPELVSGLGRPEDKKGGRKPKAKPETAVATTEGTPEGGEESSEDPNLTPDLGEQQTVFKVCKKSDGTVVAEGLSFEQAKALVEKAAQAKKAKLYWV